MGPSTAIWGGIPCVILLDDSMDQRGFTDHMDRMFTQIGRGHRLILGVSDDVPPDVNLDRLEQIKQWIQAFGPVS